TSKPSWIGSSKPTYDLSEISETTTYKRVTQSEKNTWNGKQNALGFTPENSANKITSVRTSGASDTNYVSELGVKTYVDGLIGGVYSPSNKPSWSDVQSKPSWIGSSKPTYDLDEISDGTTY